MGEISFDILFEEICGHDFLDGGGYPGSGRYCISLLAFMDASDNGCGGH